MMLMLDILIALGVAVVAGVSFWLGRKSVRISGAAWQRPGWRLWGRS